VLLRGEGFIREYAVLKLNCYVNLLHTSDFSEYLYLNNVNMQLKDKAYHACTTISAYRVCRLLLIVFGSLFLLLLVLPGSAHVWSRAQLENTAGV